jgi:alkylation response protein AidB-like acyl-CoA dehydrogenase
VNFDLSDDQEALRDGIRSFCDGRFTMARVREGFDAAAYEELAATGVFSLRADGFRASDAGIAFQELGRALVPGPLVWAHLAHGRVDGIVTGLERPAPGVPAMIEHLDVAEVVLVIDDAGIARLPADDLGAAKPLDWPLDPLTPVHRVDELPQGARIGDAALAAQWRTSGALLTSAYQVGMAQRCTEVATVYALERQQFDRPIGSFQAVKHLLADMAVRAEIARAAVDAAACTIDDPEIGDVQRAVAGARLLAGEAALRNAKSSLQVHGGMGFTWEVDVHLFLKRAWVLNTVFGAAAQHADTLAARL